MKKILVFLCFISVFAYGQAPAPFIIHPNGVQSLRVPITAYDVMRIADMTNYVPSTRTITINGVTYDMSVNRSWTIPVADTTTYRTVANSLSLSQLQTKFNLYTPVSRTLTINGVAFNLSTDRNFATNFINGTAGTNRDFYYSSSNSQRWISRVNSVAETGGNAGSNWELDRRADDGSNLGAVISADRSTGVVSIPSITGTLSGNATTATTLQNARTINGVSFNGSANITVVDATKEPIISGTGLVRKSGTTTTFDNSTYLTSYTETDPTVPSNVKAITGTNISNWNAAFSWGNHATAGYAHLAGTEFFSGYKRFQADAGIDRALYMGSAANDNPSIGDIIQMSNTNDASTTTAGYALQLGTGSDFLFNSFNGAPGSISFIPRFRMTNAGLLNYSADMSASYTARSVVDKAYVDAHSAGETRFDVDWFVNSSSTFGASNFNGYSTLVISVDCSNGNKTVVLPAVSVMAGKKIIVIKIDASANTVSILRDGETVLINGAYTYTLTTRYQSVELRTGGNVYSSVGADQYYAR